MARLGLQRQAEAEIALEFCSDLGAISDGSSVVRDEHGSFVQGLHRADLAGVKSLNQRRDDAFGFSGERIGLGHQGLLSCWLNCDAACAGVRGSRRAGSRIQRRWEPRTPLPVVAAEPAFNPAPPGIPSRASLYAARGHRQSPSRRTPYARTVSSSAESASRTMQPLTVVCGPCGTPALAA